MRRGTSSWTARKVALNILTLGAVPGMEDVLPRGVVDATVKLLVASGAASATTVRWSRSRRMVSVYRAFDWMMPGQFEAFAHRKAFCERQVRSGIAAGATQVLALGAGYDTLAWRLAPEFVGVRFFEIDHPATARLKAAGIDAMGPRANLHLVSEDLGTRQLVDVLQAHDAWDPTALTVILAEGLLMYLRPDAVQNLLEQCAVVAGVGTRLAFTYVATRPDGLPDAGPWTRLVLWILKINGEPWLWSARPDELGSFFGEHGWAYAPDLVGPTGKRGVEYFGVAVRWRRTTRAWTGRLQVVPDTSAPQTKGGDLPRRIGASSYSDLPEGQMQRASNHSLWFEPRSTWGARHHWRSPVSTRRRPFLIVGSDRDWYDVGVLSYVACGSRHLPSSVQ